MSDVFMNNILVGLALVVSNILTLIFASRMPRRAMLLLSSAGIAVTLVVLGVFFHLKALEAELCAESAAANATDAFNVSATPPPPRAEMLLEVGGGSRTSFVA